MTDIRDQEIENHDILERETKKAIECQARRKLAMALDDELRTTEEDWGPPSSIVLMARAASVIMKGERLNNTEKTLRDEFAMAALAGDMAAQNEQTGTWPNTASDDFLEERAAFFYRFADAMMRVRDKKQD